MKTLILTKAQLNEYIERKRAEKTFYNIIEEIHKTKKYLNESISHQKTNQSIIDNYKRKNLITPLVFEMLVKHQIINENYEII